MRRLRGFGAMVDIEATAINADRILNQYQHRIAKTKRYSGLKSPLMDGMPKTAVSYNSIETQIVDRLSDDEFCIKCEQIVTEGITNEVYSKILKYTYITPLGTDNEIMDRVGYGRSSFYRKRKKALVAFAEQWPPLPSELMVYKNGTTKTQ